MSWKSFLHVNFISQTAVQARSIYNLTKMPKIPIRSLRTDVGCVMELVVDSIAFSAHWLQKEFFFSYDRTGNGQHCALLRPSTKLRVLSTSSSSTSEYTSLKVRERGIH